MADVDAVVVVAGEVRHVEKKRDFTNRATGEVRPGKGRKAKVLTYGGFLDLSVPEEFDSERFEEGDVIAARARVVPWVIFAERGPNNEIVRPERHGTAYVFDGWLTEEQMIALRPAVGAKA